MPNLKIMGKARRFTYCQSVDSQSITLRITSPCSSRLASVAHRDHRACRPTSSVLTILRAKLGEVSELTYPHFDGTIKSFGSFSVKLMRLQSSVSAGLIQNIVMPYSFAASDTGILLRSRSSLSRALSSFNRLSFNSAILCFLLRPISAMRGSKPNEDDIMPRGGELRWIRRMQGRVTVHWVGR